VNEDGEAAAEEVFVEVARAHDPLEATVWTRNLEDMGIEVQTQRKGGWIRSLLWLGQVPVAVLVRSKDHERALDYLKRFRFI
jgi:hypothetical protein